MGRNRGIGMNTLNNEKGAVLITMLLLLIVITLAGIIAINVSTVDIQIARYTRESSTAFGGAEAGVDVAIPLIEDTLENSALQDDPTGYAFDADLADEITGGSDNNTDTPNSATPDITITNINGATVKIDIDRLYSYTLPGSNVGFASGYEGIGAGSAGGGTAILYRIDAQATRD